MFFCLFAIFSSSLTIFLPLSTSVVNVVDLSPWRQSVKHLDISVCPRRVDAWALERPSYSLTVTTPSACCSIDARACHAGHLPSVVISFFFCSLLLRLL
ncbi:Inactive leucine-rich repeat receptor-like serine/threonine-protein kinase [Trichinella pseudospiralis]